MKVSGFTFVRNGVTFAYPFLESLKSLLPLVDELIINVPESDDDTLERVETLNDPKIKIFTSDWDTSLREGGQILSLQTNRALERCSGDWAIYLQADEVFHEDDYAGIRAAMEQHKDDSGIEGLRFRYLHFEGSYWLVNPLRYRRQVRIVRPGGNVVSWGDACGFKHPDGGNIRSADISSHVYHYGWARPPVKMLSKNRELEKLYHDDKYISNKYDGKIDHQFENREVCIPFDGEHPSVMQNIVSKEAAKPAPLKRPYLLRPLVWRWLLKKWGLIR